MKETNQLSTSATLKELRDSLGLLTTFEQKEYKIWISRIEKRHKNKQPVDRSLTKLKKQLSSKTESITSRRNNLPTIEFPELLPITQHVNELIKAIDENQVIIVAGETGSGNGDRYDYNRPPRSIRKPTSSRSCS